MANTSGGFLDLGVEDAQLIDQIGQKGEYV